MNKKTCLIQLTLLVALTFFILQFFTTTVKFESKIDTGRNLIYYTDHANSQVTTQVLPKNLTNVANHHHLKVWSQRVEMKKNKRILLWGTFYGIQPQLKDFCIMNENTLDFCEYKCEYSVDHSEHNVNQSDAIVFHGRENMTKFPKDRPNHQRWVFLMFESPLNSWTNFSHWNNIFDWTMSYRPDSDVFIPYGKLTSVSKSKVEMATDIVSRKENMGFLKLASWASTNFRYVTSGRRAIVRELSKFISVDLYGIRGPYRCPGSSSNQCDDPQKCFEYLGHRYKFYFAFENSICEDYITEKFFLPLKYGMVPVVHGPSKDFYLKHAPASAFIHVGDYPNLKDLADYLLYLDKNDDEYMKYFSWRKDYVLDQVNYFQRAWCNLCEKLHKDSTTTAKDKRPNHVLYPSVHEWWFKKSVNSKENEICKKVVVMQNATFKYH